MNATIMKHYVMHFLNISYSALGVIGRKYIIQVVLPGDIPSPSQVLNDEWQASNLFFSTLKDDHLLSNGNRSLPGFNLCSLGL